MPKRRISKKQRERISASQAKRRQKATDNSDALADLNPSDLGPEQSGLVIAHFGKMADVEDQTGQVHRCLLRQHLGVLVAGDKVIWQSAPTGGVITARKDRDSVICRPDFYGELKPVAANIHQLMIVAAPEPELSTLLIDSYLVAAIALSIKPIIVLNKIDLLGSEEQCDVRDVISVYRALGFTSIEISTVDSHGLDDCINLLKDETSVFVGQSGVGKSSIISKLLPDQDIETRAISAQSKLGSHTTTTAKLYHLPTGGQLIDSPGIREFKLSSFTQEEINQAYPEIQAAASNCKFRNCMHRSEIECAVQEKLEAGLISPFRFHNYNKLLTSYT